MGLLSALFGGSKSESTSNNKAFDTLSDALTPAITSGVGNMNALNEELSGGFEGYKKNAGFDTVLGEGLRGITGVNAAKGILNSGMTGKAYQRYGMGLTGSFYDNFLNKLKEASGLGLGAAQTLAGAGQEGTSTGNSQNGIIPGLFSDRSVKENIRRVGQLDNGLPVYAYTYEGDKQGRVQIGLMADEVEQVNPDAVGEATWYRGGRTVKTVDYGKAVM